MISRLLRIFFAIEFLVALPAFFTLWSQAGGQYHLDLMFWPWKFGFGVSAAALTTALTREFVHSEGKWSRRALALSVLLLLVFLSAGIVTYHYHLNEPIDEDPDAAPLTTTRIIAPDIPRWRSQNLSASNY